MLQALLLVALTPLAAAEPRLDGSVSAEATVGRLYALSLLGDIGLADTIYLVGGYGFVRPADVPAFDQAPAVKPVPSHLISLGLDYSPSRHWLLSFHATGSPRARDEVLLNPTARPNLLVRMSTFRESLSGFLGVVYDSAGFSNLEWSADLGVSGATYRLGRAVQVGSRDPIERSDPLQTLRPTAGVTLTAFADHDFSVRGAYSLYSADPLTAGRFTDQELATLATAFAAVASRLVRDIDVLQSVANNALARLGQADAMSGFTTAPVWFELRGSYLWRFTCTMSAQVMTSYLRYVPTQGWAVLLSGRFAWKLPKGFRVWLAATVQRDEPLDFPDGRTAQDPQPMWSGLGTLGIEFSP